MLQVRPQYLEFTAGGFEHVESAHFSSLFVTSGSGEDAGTTTTAAGGTGFAGDAAFCLAFDTLSLQSFEQ